MYTDHRTLENFLLQKALSWRQARWLEELSQFDMTIRYIRGEDNCVADALSRLPPEDDVIGDVDPNEKDLSSWKAWLETTAHASVGAIHEATTAKAMTLRIAADRKLLSQIRVGYKEDEFCRKFITGERIMPAVEEKDGLWFIAGRLLIPRTGSIHEDLFRLAHDAMGHFGADKNYATLRDSYYWPNMRRDLEQAYVPACTDCARNKADTHPHKGPLHPLAVPDDRGKSVGMDFIGPLPEEDRYDYVVTMTDCLGSDVQIVPCRTDMTAEQFADIFFDNWYCENGMPEEFVTDHNKLFMSRF